MKAILPVLLLATSLTLAPAQTDGLPTGGNARITETGPHHRVWTRTVEEPTAYGEARRVEHRYVEMASGLNYLEDGVWKESREEIEISQGHAVARKGQHKVIFAGDSVGETVAGSTGSPSRQQHVGLVNAQAGTVRGARFLYARTALCPAGTSLTAEDVQFVDCGNAIDAWGQPVTVRNGLFSLVNYAVANHVANLALTGEHWTADTFTSVVHIAGGYNGCSINMTNSLFTAGTNWVSGTNAYSFNTNALTWLASSAGVYRTVGAGAYYLADGSPYRDSGATNLSASALALIRARTTYPPVVVSNSPITTDTTLNPQAARDTGVPDRGYHYPPLDYAVSAVTVSNATVTLPF